MKSFLSAWWDGRIAGQLTLDEHVDMGFAYDSGWLADSEARPISRSLPLRAKAFDRRETRPFFAGLSASNIAPSWRPIASLYWLNRLPAETFSN